ncbi:MAG: hypothetical protein K2N16_00590 [Muribaculaceae bacterium]|nr:hypothetical protein [Muribaculaceae bacterium]
MIKKLLTIMLAAILPLAASAASAKQALDKASAKINDAGSVTAKFTATSNGITAAGSITIAKQKFNMIGADFGVWYNGNDLWSYSKDAGETTLTYPIGDELLEINPFDIIHNYSALYTVSKVSEAGGKCVVKLKSIKQNNMVSTALVTIDTSTWLPTAIEATFTNGSTMKIAITDAKVSDKAPAASTFEYPANKYPGVEVIDLR